MLNKLLAFVKQYKLITPGDHVICAVSGGADSVALLFALYLLREKLGITLSAAHFNHRLRQDESDRDEQFVRDFCAQYDIALHVGSGTVAPGKKGLEAAAREARYAFLGTLDGKIATAHTANDNAETVLMHMVRGTGLKGLGGIMPQNGQMIRPLLTTTRQEILVFLQEYHLSYVVDSSNETDAFLRNRLRHHVVPLLEQENPKLAENLSELALRLRQDELALSSLAETDKLPSVPELRAMPQALRSRAVVAFLEKSGVPEPESSHIAMVDDLVFSDKPSATADLPGGITIRRNYDALEAGSVSEALKDRILTCPGSVDFPELGIRLVCQPAKEKQFKTDCFTVVPKGTILVRHRQAGDTMRLQGGTKDIKKLFIDRKIPAGDRLSIPVIADDTGVLGVYGIGANLDRLSGRGDLVQISFVAI